MAWRRVTKSENAYQNKQRYMVNTNTGQIVTRTKYQGIQAGKPRDAAIREKRRTTSDIQQFRARQTRVRNKELRELLGKKAGPKTIAPKDSFIITRYISLGHDFRRLSASDKDAFKNLFTRYPADLVREWLGSSEQSRAIRYAVDQGKSWNKFNGLRAA